MTTLRRGWERCLISALAEVNIASAGYFNIFKFTSIFTLLRYNNNTVTHYGNFQYIHKKVRYRAITIITSYAPVH